MPSKISELDVSSAERRAADDATVRRLLDSIDE
jgi:hypothetical protein